MENNKVIISCAMTGAVTPKEKNAAVPVTPQEIADDVYKVWKAGAAICHLHMRDDKWQGTMDAKRFAETVKLIRAHEDCDIIINCTSSGEFGASDERRIEHFKEVPEIEIGSYDVGTFLWGGGSTFYNTPDFLKMTAEVYKEHNVKPECEIFDMGMVSNAKWMIKNGMLENTPEHPMFCQLVLGVVGGMDATVENLIYLVNHLPEGAMWSTTGIGTGHLPILYATIAMGGHVRVGLEDNLYMARGVKATNVSLVERAVDAVKEFNKQPATPAEARQMLGLAPLVR